MPWFGRGWGWRWWFWATGLPGWLRWAYPFPWLQPYMTPEDELEYLESLKSDLEKELEDIKKRIEELRKELGKQ